VQQVKPGALQSASAVQGRPRSQVSRVWQPGAMALSQQSKGVGHSAFEAQVCPTAQSASVEQVLLLPQQMSPDPAPQSAALAQSRPL